MTCLCPTTNSYGFLCTGRNIWVASAQEHAECPGVKEQPQQRFVNVGLCDQRGENTGTREGSCGSHAAMIDVYACPRHGECTIRKVVKGVQCCIVCNHHSNRREQEQ